MRQKINLLTKEATIEKLFLLSLFLIKLPSFYVFFPIRSLLFTTHSLVRVIVLVLFVIVAAKQIFKQEMLFGKKEKLILNIFLVYFVFQSISIFSAVNVSSFLFRYKDVIFPGLYLFVALSLPKLRNKIIFVFIITSVINFIYQMVMFWAPGLFQTLGEILIYEPHFEVIKINLQRARLFIETYDEITIPFLFILAAKYKKPNQRILILAGFLLIVIPSLLSNFRTRMLMLAFAFLASLLFLLGKKIRIKINFLAAFVVVVYLSSILASAITGFSFIDRLTFQHQREDTGTIEVRTKNIERATEMGLAFPIFGVGLGNYFDYLTARNFVGQSAFSWVNKETELAANNPHNIFAQIVSETGIISLLFYVAMLGYFAKVDFESMFKPQKDYYKIAFIISFWTLFIYSLFNPTTTFSYNSIFWILRGII